MFKYSKLRSKLRLAFTISTLAREQKVVGLEKLEQRPLEKKILC